MRFDRHALNVSAVAVVLAGCGGSQPPFGAQGAIKYTHAVPEIQPQSSYLYVWEVNSTDVAVVAYPAFKIVRRLKATGSLCTDPRTGNLYVNNGNYIAEYAPGGSSQIGSTGLPYGYSGQGCAVDPTTGDVAIVGLKWQTSPKVAAVLVYSSLNESPVSYTDSNVASFDFAGFDDKGNLFIDDATSLTELPNGSSTFVPIQLSQHHLGGTVQWDGEYITVETPHPHMMIYRVAIQGSTGKIVGTTKVGVRRNRFDLPLYSWIYGGVVIAPAGNQKFNKDIGVWSYPDGGKAPSQTFGTFHYIWSVAAGKS
jgi:hypothetical protein